MKYVAREHVDDFMNALEDVIEARIRIYKEEENYCFSESRRLRREMLDPAKERMSDCLVDMINDVQNEIEKQQLAK